jgi:predicted SAM-dependent methyltransferase
VSGDVDVARLALARRDYVRHPLLLGGIILCSVGARRTTGPLRRALVIAVSEMKTAVCHRRGVARARRLLAGASGIRLHLACGGHRLPGWLNVDIVPGVDLRLDVRRPMPLPDASCIEIYAEHFVEHLAYPGDVEAVLRDWWRLLAPGGRLSVGVPDAATSLAAHVADPRGHFAACVGQPWAPAWAETSLDLINYLFRQQELGFGQDHLYAYDFETCAARLAAAGFADIGRRPFDPARDSRPGSLYVDATRR